MSRCPGPHLLSCGVCGGTDAGLLARAEAAERERDRLRAALEKAKGPIAIAASYADSPEVSVGMRVHARDCARILPEINAALAEEAPCPFCGHDGPLCRDVWPTGQLLCTRHQGHAGEHIACLSGAGLHATQRWARHATKENGDCADWCRACEDEARARAALDRLEEVGNV